MSSAPRPTILFRGSAHLITQFLGYAINSVLFQRRVFPPDNFDAKHAYDTTVHVTNNELLNRYINRFLYKTHEWVQHGKVEKVVVAIVSLPRNETIERWTFDMKLVQDGAQHECDKATEEIRSDINRTMNQIASFADILPRMTEACTFDLLAHVKDPKEMDAGWEESNVDQAMDTAAFQLHSFTTNVHQIGGRVSYKDTVG